MTLIADVKAILASETIVTAGGALPGKGPFVIVEGDAGNMDGDLPRYYARVSVFSSHDTAEMASEQAEADLSRIVDLLRADARVVVHTWSGESEAPVNDANQAVWLTRDISVSDF